MSRAAEQGREGPAVPGRLGTESPRVLSRPSQHHAQQARHRLPPRPTGPLGKNAGGLLPHTPLPPRTGASGRAAMSLPSRVRHQDLAAGGGSRGLPRSGSGAGRGPAAVRALRTPRSAERIGGGQGSDISRRTFHWPAGCWDGRAPGETLNPRGAGRPPPSCPPRLDPRPPLAPRPGPRSPGVFDAPAAPKGRRHRRPYVPRLASPF